jgi:anti-repressor protein
MNNANLAIFHFQNQNIRTKFIDNKPYFCASDICKILEINNGRDAINRIEKDDVVLTDIIDSLGRQQKASFVNEAGLYALIFQSRKKEAKQFKKWIFNDVLPQIRKTGSYNSISQLTQSDQLLLFAEELIKTKEENKQLQYKTEKQQEVIDKHVVIGNNKNYTEVAKILHIPPHKFIDYLKDNKYIMFDRMPYQKYLANGYFTIKTSDKGYERYLITPKGFEYLIRVLKTLDN